MIKFTLKLLAAVAIPVMIYSAVAKVQNGVLTFSSAVSTTGDVAQVMKFTPTSAVDNQVYKDTVVVNVADDSVVVSWTAPAAATDVAMVCDSMAKYVNASACSLYVTAEDKTTYWQITSDDAGLAFDVFLADTAHDTTHTTLNVATYSSTRDTFGIPVKPEDGLWGWAILSASANTEQGYGLVDSGKLWLYATSAGERFLLDSSLKASLPCSLRISIPDAAGSDTVFKEGLEIDAYVTDSSSDGTMTALHKLAWYFIVR